MKAIRAALIVAGLATASLGVVYLLDIGLDNLVATTWWLVGGVIAHDAFLAPATIVVVVIAARFLPGWLRPSASVGLVILGTVTVMAIPVLGRFGARADNPSLLDRHYVLGWVVFATLVASYVVGAGWRRRRTAQAAEGGTAR